MKSIIMEHIERRSERTAGTSVVKAHTKTRTMRGVFIIALFIGFISMYSSSVQSISIGGVSEQDRILLFEPRLERNYTFTLGNAERIRSTLTGDLTQYAQLTDPEQDSGPRSVLLSLKLPGYLQPGQYIMYVGAREIQTQSSGSVTALASIRTRIVINVLHQDKMIAVETVNITPRSENSELLTIAIDSLNTGSKSIDEAIPVMTFYDEKNASIVTIQLNAQKSASADPLRVMQYAEEVNTTTLGLKPGTYRVETYIRFDKLETPLHEQIITISDAKRKISAQQWIITLLGILVIALTYVNYRYNKKQKHQNEKKHKDNTKSKKKRGSGI